MLPLTSDRISQIMGQNLLKGFALLDEYCGTCEVTFAHIFLMCSFHEIDLFVTQTPLMRDPQKNLLCVACPLMKQVHKSDESSLALPGTKKLAISAKTVNECEVALRSKLEWAVDELHLTTDVKHCIELNVLIKGLVENIKLLRQVE